MAKIEGRVAEVVKAQSNFQTSGGGERNKYIPSYASYVLVL